MDEKPAKKKTCAEKLADGEDDYYSDTKLDITKVPFRDRFAVWIMGTKYGIDKAGNPALPNKVYDVENSSTDY